MAVPVLPTYRVAVLSEPPLGMVSDPLVPDTSPTLVVPDEVKLTVPGMVAGPRRVRAPVMALPPEKVTVALPAWTKLPLPLMGAAVPPLAELKINVPLSTKADVGGRPVAPPTPNCSVPAETVVAPV